MAEHNKAMAAAKSEEAKDNIVSSLEWDSAVPHWLVSLACLWWVGHLLLLQKTQKQNTTTGLRTCNNILAMSKVKFNLIFVV